MVKPYLICWHCLRAIETKEGAQATIERYVDDACCGWCGENAFDLLFELVEVK